MLYELVGFTDMTRLDSLPDISNVPLLKICAHLVEYDDA